MEENEIYTRLGLENKEELMELLDLSDRVQKIKYFYPSIDIKTTQPVRLALRNGNFFEITGMDNNRIQRLKCSREGWETVLRLNNNSNSLPPLRNNPNKFPKGNIPKGDESEWYFHRGHILARQFHKYVLGNKILDYKYKNTKRIWTDLCIDSKKNLFTQFSSANQIQAKIEAEVFALLSENQNVYYEVKVIFKNINDIYPIGTEIFYLPISSPEKFKHCFIPNTDLDFDLSILHEKDSKLSYPDFYKNGYREEYRKYFKNNDRGEYELAEGLVCRIGDSVFYLVEDRAIFNSPEFLQNTEKFEEFTKDNIAEISNKLSGKTFYPVRVGREPGIYFDYGNTYKQVAYISGVRPPKKTSNLYYAMSKNPVSLADGMYWIE